MYIVDDVGALCGDCLDLSRPPWRLDNLDRWWWYLYYVLRRTSLSEGDTELIAEFLAPKWVP